MVGREHHLPVPVFIGSGVVLDRHGAKRANGNTLHEEEVVARIASLMGAGGQGRMDEGECGYRDCREYQYSRNAGVC